MSNETRQEILSMMPKDLLNYLKERRVLTKYVNNLHACCKQKVRKLYPKVSEEEYSKKLRERIQSVFCSVNIIASSFDWERSNEGYDFWMNCNDGYLRRLWEKV